MKKPAHYKTDGRLVESSEGGFMGIFSTVSLLNDKEIQNHKMRTCLEEMANEDFRGNRNPLSVKAFNLLKEMGLRK